MTAPIYTGSASKVLLAELEVAEIQFLLGQLNMVRIGPNTITDKRDLLKEIEKVGKQGYATSFRERLPEGASMSVPIKGYITPVALSVLGSYNRFSNKVMMDILKEMKRSATRITSRLSESRQWGERIERQLSHP